MIASEPSGERKKVTESCQVAPTASIKDIVIIAASGCAPLFTYPLPLAVRRQSFVEGEAEETRRFARSHSREVTPDKTIPGDDLHLIYCSGEDTPMAARHMGNGRVTTAHAGRYPSLLTRNARERFGKGPYLPRQTVGMLDRTTRSWLELREAYCPWTTCKVDCSTPSQPPPLCNIPNILEQSKSLPRIASQ